MPGSPSWFARLDDIVAAVEYAALPTFDRAWIGELFNLQRTAAATLLKRIPGSFSSGHTWMIHKRELLLWLYKVKKEGAWESDAARQRRVLAAIQPMHDRLDGGGGGGRFLVQESHARIIRASSLDSLPAGVTVGKGRISIEFFGWEDMLFQLGGLIHAIDNDYIRLREVVDE